MSENQTSPNLFTLSMGAIVWLAQIIAGSNWTSSPKEKINAGRLKALFEPHLLSQPDACRVPGNHPDYFTAATDAGKALREWRKKVATLELTDGQRIAVTSCVKFNANQAGGADEFVAEALTVFGILE